MASHGGLGVLGAVGWGDSVHVRVLPSPTGKLTFLTRQQPHSTRAHLALAAVPSAKEVTWSTPQSV